MTYWQRFKGGYTVEPQAPYADGIMTGADLLDGGHTDDPGHAHGQRIYDNLGRARIDNREPLMPYVGGVLDEAKKLADAVAKRPEWQRVKIGSEVSEALKGIVRDGE